jgi:tRNA nucleotidyltransferase (CCA-adding enzyme)
MFSDHPYSKIIGTLADLFKQNSYELYLVGGVVRDHYRGVACDDLDFTTDARPDQITQIFESKNLPIIPSGEQFGTMTTRVDGIKIEITTFRSDVYNTSSRKPLVTFGNSITEDLMRRDFTMNTIAFNTQTGDIIECGSGILDINRKIIRAVGDPSIRFSEDPLRMLRAIRFVSQLGFMIEPFTFYSILNCSSMISRISEERCRDELVKILLGNNAYHAMQLLFLCGLGDKLLPEFTSMIGCDQPKDHHEYDVFTHTLKLMQEVPRLSFVRLAALFHDVGKPSSKTLDPTTNQPHFYGHHKVGADITRDIMDRLKFSVKQREIVAHIVYRHMTPHLLFDPTYKSVRRLVNRCDFYIGDELAVPTEVIVEFAKLDSIASGKSKDLERYDIILGLICEVRQSKEDILVSPLDGKEIMNALGVGPCILVGRIKKLLIERVLDDLLPANDAVAALEYIENEIKPGLIIRSYDIDPLLTKDVQNV